METRITGAIVGLGMMGTNHLRVLSGMADVELLALVDGKEEALSTAKRMCPRAASYRSIEAAVGCHRLDFVCVAVPAAHLATVAEAAFELTDVVFVEKPLASSEEEARRLVQTAVDRKKRLTVGYVERFNPAVVALKQKLQEGYLGRLFQLHARRLSQFPQRESMTGVALDLATHDIDVMRYVTGSDVIRVFAEAAQRTHDRGEDLVSACLRFQNDVTGLLEANWLTPTKVRELTVTGERGMFVVDYLTQDLRFFEYPRAVSDWEAVEIVRGPAEGDMIRFGLERREPLAVEWREFIAALRSKGDFRVTPDDAVAALSTAEAVRRSGELHEVVVPSYLDGSFDSRAAVG